MKEFKKVKTTESHLSKIQCDCCNAIEFPSAPLKFQEYITIRKSGGYSSIFGDCTVWECDLCEVCLKKLLGKYLKKIADF
jgi:hypothetical protein